MFGTIWREYVVVESAIWNRLPHLGMECAPATTSVEARTVMTTTPVIENAVDLHQAWGERFNAGDVAGMLALAEPGSAFVPQPGSLVTDDGYQAAAAGFVAMGLPINLTLRHSYVSGDLALLIYDWTIKGTDTAGNQVDLAGSTADVARRGADGWRFVIDNPFGTA
jgi:ketosteroid isomerase-like protein